MSPAARVPRAATRPRPRRKALPPEVARLRVVPTGRSASTPSWYVFDGPSPDDLVAIVSRINAGYRAKRLDQGHFTDHPSLAHAVEFATRPNQEES